MTTVIRNFVKILPSKNILQTLARTRAHVSPLKNMESLKDKTVFITGASAGIGAATAVAFAKYGSKLALTGRNRENLEKVAQDCHEAGLEKEKIHTIVGDLAKEEDIKNLVDNSISHFGAIDILVNNAGMGAAGNIEEMKLEDLDTMYNVDVRAIVSLTQKFVPHLKKTKGVIVNVSTVLSTVPLTSTMGYCMLKASVDQFTRCLAMDLAPYRIRVNAINPGTIRTDILHKSGYMAKEDEDEYYKDTASKYPLGRVGTPEDIASGIVFLSSDMSSFMTGHLLVVDGGASHTVAVI